LSLVSKRKEPTTAIVTALYYRPKRGVDLLADDYRTFLEKVKRFCSFLKKYNVPIESITGMQNGLGIPDLEKLKEFIEFIREKNLNIEEISGKRIGKGIPSIKELEQEYRS
jgi:hypothetical protein